MPETEFITDRQIYERVLQEQVPNAKDFVWIGTSDITGSAVDPDTQTRRVKGCESLCEQSGDDPGQHVTAARSRHAGIACRIRPNFGRTYNRGRSTFDNHDQTVIGRHLLRG